MPADHFFVRCGECIKNRKEKSSRTSPILIVIIEFLAVISVTTETERLFEPLGPI